MSHAVSLLNAIREEPDNLVLRHVYGDWLADHDDPLGEFIQLQCGESDDAGQMRAAELLRLHGNEWLAPLRAITDAEAVFRHGFVERVHLPAAAFVAHGAAIFDLLPALSEVSLTESGPSMATLAACPALARARRLILTGNHLGNQELATLAGSPHVRSVVGLDLSNNQITADGIMALDAAGLPLLRHLDLSGNPIGDYEIQTLATATSLHRLESFRMIRNCLSSDDFVPILRTPLRNALTEECFGNLAAGPVGAPLLVEVAQDRQMHEVRLHLDNEGAAALSGSPHLHHVKGLDLACSSITSAGLARLLEAPSLTALESLDLGFISDIGDDGVRSLADSPALAGLRHLDLICVHMTAEGVVALAASPHAGDLNWLRLCQNDIGDRGVEAIAHSRTMTGLTELHLDQCAVGDRGAGALGRSPNAEQLTHLGLNTNQLTDVGVAALCESPRLAKLQSLELVGNGLGDAGGNALADAKCLTALRHLDLRGCVFSRDVRRKLVARYGEAVLLTAAQSEHEDRRPFMLAIAANPDDDAQRLAFADWLDDRDPERAEFIRVQCTLSGLQEGDALREELEGREAELLAGNLKRWHGELPSLPGINWDWLGNRDNLESAFDRGLFQRVRIGTLRQLEPQQEEVFGATVIRRLVMSSARDVQGAHWKLDSRTAVQFAEAVASLPCLSQLLALDLGGNGLAAEAIRPLIGTRALSGLRELDLSGNPLGDDGIAVLAGCPHLGNLERLVLSSVEAGSRGLETLMASANLPRLRHLSLDYNNLTSEALRTLLSARRPGLESISLQGNMLNDEGLIAFAECSPQPALQALDLERNYPTAVGLRALFGSPVIGTLRSLRIPNFQDCEGALVALSRSEYASQLCHLDIDNLDVGWQDFTALAGASNLPNLRELDVGQIYHEVPGFVSCFFDAPLTRQLTRLHIHLCPIQAEDLRRLIRSLGVGRIRCLRLWRCTLGDAGAQVLAESEELRGLEELDLFENAIGRAGAEALASSPHLEGLRKLGLNSNPIGSAGAAALAESVHLGGLRDLDMRQCDVGTPGARAIAAAWRWKQLVSLNLGENRIGTSGAGALAESAVLVWLLSLSLDQNQVGTDGIEALERSPRITSFGYQRPA